MSSLSERLEGMAEKQQTCYVEDCDFINKSKGILTQCDVYFLSSDNSISLIYGCVRLIQ